MVTMTSLDLSSKLWWSPLRLPLLGIITPTLNYIPTHRWQSNSQHNHRRLPNGAYEQPWRRHQILCPFPPVVLFEYLQRVFYNTNYHMLPGGAHGLTWRRLKILCPQIFFFFTFFGKTTNSIRPRHYCRSAFLRNPCCWLSVPPQSL